jgi:class 3 adenylate cyclase
MGDGVNIAARLEGVAKPGTICLSEDAYRQVKGRLDLKVTDLGATHLKNIVEPIQLVFRAEGSERQGSELGADSTGQVLVPLLPSLRAHAGVL